VELELRVEPGLALDPYGRLVELRGAHCIRLARWFAAQPDGVLANALRRGAQPAVVADVFLAARDCARGKTPAFATGPFDALDAVVPARLAEEAMLSLLPRAEAGEPPLPRNAWPDSADPARRLQAVLGSWNQGTDEGGLPPLAEHVEGQDPGALFLARVLIPADPPPGAAGQRPRLDMTRRVSVDNTARPFVWLPGKWAGHPPALEPLAQP
jgi:hypothetical protein